jgi:hypothetical protein
VYIHTLFCNIRSLILRITGPIVILKRLNGWYLLDTIHYHFFPWVFWKDPQETIARIYFPDETIITYFRGVCPSGQISQITNNLSNTVAPKRKNIGLYFEGEMISHNLGILDMYYRHCTYSSITRLDKVLKILDMPCDQIIYTKISVPSITTIKYDPRELDISDIYY